MGTYELSDISTQFREFRSPVVLDYLAVVAGHEGHDTEAPFRFLACGERIAMSAATLAASFPQGEFHVLETDAAYREKIRDLMEAAGLENTRFHEVAIEDPEAPPLDLPEFDYVSVHGLYAQVGPVGRESLEQILRGRLRPNGLAFLSYCAFPGWAALTPLRALLRDAARKSHAEGGTVEAPLALAERLRQENALYFQDVPVAAEVLALYSALPPESLLREFLSPNFEPVGFDVVSERMTECGLTFVGSHPIYLNHVDMALPSNFRSVVHAVEDRLERERLMDFVLATKVRDDVYIKRAPEPAEEEAAASSAPLLRTVVGTPLPAHEIERTTHLPHATVHFGGGVYELLIQALAQGATRLEDLLARPQFAAFDKDAVLEAVRLLVASGQFHPMARPAESAFDPQAPDFELVSAFNRVVLRRALLPAEDALSEASVQEVLLSSPVAGNGILVPFEEAMILLAVSEGGYLGAAAWAWRALGAEKSDTNPRAFEAAFMSSLEHFRYYRLNKYFELGVVQRRTEETQASETQSAQSQSSQTDSPKT